MDAPSRLLPRITPDNEPFWTSGARGELRIVRCRSCRLWIHPPAPVCPRCLSRDVAPEAVSGRGRVHTFTVNHQRWDPSWPDRYVIAVVELDEQPGLRLTTNVAGCRPEDVRIGMPVAVRFERHDDVWIPLFVPETA